MTLPLFYIETIDDGAATIILNEESSKHAVQVLRLQPGEQLLLTDGKGNLLTAEITDDNRKRCSVKILQTTNYKPPTTNIIIAISLIKNSSRFEWFLEKATEIGVTEIIPLLCERTEKQHFRYDRMKTILVSAMLQSGQCWLPVLHEPVKFKNLKMAQFENAQKFIAHCIDQEKRNLTDLINETLSTKIILIGPEGDFTKEETDLAILHHFIPVSLGDTRLRTETAGVVAATLLRLV